MLQYLNDVKTGVDTESGNQCDLADVSEFHRAHLEHAVEEHRKSAAPTNDEALDNALENDSLRLKQRAKWRHVLEFPFLSVSPVSHQSSSLTFDAPHSAPSASESTSKPGKKRKGRRSKASTRPRGGTAIREAGGDTPLADAMRLIRKWAHKSDIFHTTGFSVLDGRHVSTGWHGLNPPRRARAQIHRLYTNGSIVDIVATFWPVYANLLRPAILLDADNRIFLYRTTQFDWLKQAEEPFHQAVDALLADTLNSVKVQKTHAQSERGPHFPCVIGHHRQYTTKPILTLWHRQNVEKAENFIKNPLIQKITEQVSGIVKLMFPGVAERFNKSAKWHQEVYGIVPIFGLFWNLCVNEPFPNQKRIHCLPHVDSKNVVGVCVLVVYQIPGKRFNHSKRSWLVLWEAGVAIQLPPWVIVAYPSSLLYHFNLDITDFKFVTTDGNERPTPYNSTPIGEGDDEGCGSLVYFNQASMYRSSETNSGTLSVAKQKGYSDKVDYGASVEQAFLKLGTYVPLNDK